MFFEACTNFPVNRQMFNHSLPCRGYAELRMIRRSMFDVVQPSIV